MKPITKDNNKRPHFFAGAFLLALLICFGSLTVFGYSFSTKSPASMYYQTEKNEAPVFDGGGTFVSPAPVSPPSDTPLIVGHSSSLSPHDLRVILGPGRQWDSVKKKWSFRETAGGVRRATLLNSWVLSRERSGGSIASLSGSFFSEDPTRTCSGNCYPLIKYKR